MRIVGFGQDGDLNLTKVIIEDDGREYWFENPRWISVEERLPERYKHVLVATRFTDEGEPDLEIAYFSVGGWKKEEGRLYGKVTHWMPLPEPPKEG